MRVLGAANGCGRRPAVVVRRQGVTVAWRHEDTDPFGHASRHPVRRSGAGGRRSGAVSRPDPERALSPTPPSGRTGPALRALLARRGGRRPAPGATARRPCTGPRTRDGRGDGPATARIRRRRRPRERAGGHAAVAGRQQRQSGRGRGAARGRGRPRTGALPAGETPPDDRVPHGQRVGGARPARPPGRSPRQGARARADRADVGGRPGAPPRSCGCCWRPARGWTNRSGVYPQVVSSSGNADRSGVFEVMQGGYTPLLFAARRGDVASARLLVAAGADVDAAAASGTSPLVVAAHSGHGALAAFLLEAGADPGAAGAGYAALHAAVLRGRPRPGPRPARPRRRPRRGPRARHPGAAGQRRLAATPPHDRGDAVVGRGPVPRAGNPAPSRRLRRRSVARGRRRDRAHGRDPGRLEPGPLRHCPRRMPTRRPARTLDAAAAALDAGADVDARNGNGDNRAAYRRVAGARRCRRSPRRAGRVARREKRERPDPAGPGPRALPAVVLADLGATDGGADVSTVAR